MGHRFVFLKKISLLVALLLAFGSVVAAADMPVQLPEELFTVAAVDGGVEITGYIGEDIPNICVPDKLGDKPVVAIGIGAFWGNDDIVSVSLPHSVIRIGDNAFADCKRLAHFSGEAVTSIGDYAFYGCNELAGITVGGLVEFGEAALGDAVPTLSVSGNCNIDHLLSARQLIAQAGSGVSLGSVGGVDVTPEMVSLNSSLIRMLDGTVSTDLDSLWQPDLVTVAVPDVSVYTMSFVDFYAKLHSTGLYPITSTLNRAKLELRLDVMLESLLADARRL